MTRPLIPLSRPDRLPRSAIERMVERDDSPVSGGVGAVLARGGGYRWSSDTDAALLATPRHELSDLAHRIGVSLSTAQMRQEALEQRIMGLMS